MSFRITAFSSSSNGLASSTTATDDYLPGAVGEQADGYVLNLKALMEQPVADGLLAQRSWQVVISCSSV